MKLPEGWIPLDEAVKFIDDHLMTKGPRFVLDNWDCKYVDARIDMRTGQVRMVPGNVHVEKSNET